MWYLINDIYYLGSLISGSIRVEIFLRRPQKFEEISFLFWNYLVKQKISSKFVAFSEYMNFKIH